MCSAIFLGCTTLRDLTLIPSLRQQSTEILGLTPEDAGVFPFALKPRSQTPCARVSSLAVACIALTGL